jgi:phosphate-selective porin OprO/OprP
LGSSFAGRLTYLPIYEKEGQKLLHIGLSYNHNSIDTSRDDAQARLSVRPETDLTNQSLVDTGYFLAEEMNIINPELAWVNGPFSVQGEYFLMATKTSLSENPVFSGWYVQGSYFLTGEHRPYDRLNGCFDRVQPQNNFSLLQGHWGAWEVAMRYSFLDLNDRNIQGGQQRDFTVGLNWYLYPTVRVMFNYIHSVVEDRGAPPIDRGNLDTFQMRLQFAFYKAMYACLRT